MPYSYELDATNLFEILKAHAGRKPDALAFTFINEDATTVRRTFRELLLRVESLAANLQTRCRPGQHVALSYLPGLDFVEAILACFASGVVAVPVQPLRSPRHIDRFQAVLQDARCSLVLTDSASKTKALRLSQTTGDFTERFTWIATEKLALETPSEFAYQRPEPGALAFLQYTSGSTGAPKGVMVTHPNIISNQRMIRKAFCHDERTRFVGWLPLYHDMGLIGNTFQPLYLGIPAYLFAPMTFLTSPISWLKTISESRATTSGAPSFAYQLCANKISEEEKQDLDLSTWSVAFNGAEPVSALVIDEFTRQFERCGFNKRAFYPCYGMAEATLFVTGGFPQEDVREIRVDREDLLRGRAQETTGNVNP